MSRRLHELIDEAIERIHAYSKNLERRVLKGWEHKRINYFNEFVEFYSSIEKLLSAETENNLKFRPEVIEIVMDTDIVLNPKDEPEALILQIMMVNIYRSNFLKSLRDEVIAMPERFCPDTTPALPSNPISASSVKTETNIHANAVPLISNQKAKNRWIIKFKGNVYYATKRQCKIIGILVDAYKNGTGPMSEWELYKRLGDEEGKFSEDFRTDKSRGRNAKFNKAIFDELICEKVGVGGIVKLYELKV